MSRKAERRARLPFCPRARLLPPAGEFPFTYGCPAMPDHTRSPWTLFFLIFAMLYLAAGCAPHREPPEAAGARANEEIRSFVAEVQWIPLEGGFFGLVAEDGSRFLPLNLPEDFRRHGLKVRVEGEPKQVMTIHMWGMPLEIRRIERSGP
jgi:hypothetical protein